jgi:hypothetical protein
VAVTAGEASALTRTAMISSPNSALFTPILEASDGLARH